MLDSAAKDGADKAPQGMALARIRRRLSADFYLALLAIFGIVATLALAPFLIFRWSTGNLPAAIGNAGLILFPLLGFAYAWRTGRTVGPRRAIAMAMAMGCGYMVIWVGHLPYWVYPTLVANFMLVSWRFAMVTNVLLIAAVVTLAPAFSGLLDTLSFLTAVIMVMMFCMVFVIHTNFHRDRLSAIAERDELTGALNRRALSAHLEQALTGTARFNQEHVLAVLDLDDFKKVNDIYGHEAGDRVLVDFARRVMSDSRRGDLLYRLGGDEFVLLLTNTDRGGAELALANLHADIHAHPDQEAGRMRVSIGAAVSRPDETWSEWLARADSAMYQAKTAGKDRVRFAD